MTTWWNKFYPYRRKLGVTSYTEDVPVGHPLVFNLDLRKTEEQGKTLDDLSDVEVLYFDSAATPSWEVLGYGSTPNGDFEKLTFRTHTRIPSESLLRDEYYVYYGNLELGATPSRPAFIPIEWPISVVFNGAGVTYTNPGMDWVDGVSRRRGAKATFVFNGSNVRWIATVGNYGLADVQIDDGPIVEVDLYNSIASEAVVFTAEDLIVGEHTLTITAKATRHPSSLGTTINIVRLEYLKNVSVVDLGEELDPRFVWGSTTLPGA